MCPFVFYKTFPSHISIATFVALPNVIGWFRSTSPDAEVVSTLPLRYNDSFDMCPFVFYKTFPSHISVTDFTVSIFLIYHWVVSINRPSGYEPDALPLRHNDFYTPRLSRIDLSQTAFFIGYDFFAPRRQWFEPSSF